MAIKLFVSDIDGTLMGTSRKISAGNIAAVKRMVDAGIIVTIATGRMYRAALPIAQELGVDVPIITYNGALIKSVAGEVIYNEYLPAEIIVEVTNFCERNGWYLQNYSGDVVYYPARDKYSQLYESAQKVSGVEVGWDGMRALTGNVCKLLTITDSEEESVRRIEAISAEFGDRIEVTKSAAQFVEVMSRGVSKAAAVKILARKFNIERAEVMAIGDSDNDLPMLQAAGTGIAMGNAVDAVKNYCEFVTTDCDADGFAAAVDKYVFSHEQ